MSWKLIKEAPKDGTEIFGYDAKFKNRGLVKWNDGGWQIVNASGTLIRVGFYPTHYIELNYEGI